MKQQGNTMQYGIYTRATEEVLLKGMSREEAYAWMECEGTSSHGICRQWEGSWHPISSDKTLKENG